MKTQIHSCRNCGGVLKIVESQFISQCQYCQSRYYIQQDSPPAVVLKPEIGLQGAKNLILKGLRHKSVSKDFLSHSFFEKATLYYIPFFEVRGIRAGWKERLPTAVKEYSYQAFDFLEKANNLNNLQIGFFDYSIVENSILHAQQVSFNPVEMRKKGVALPAKDLNFLQRQHAPQSVDVVERHFRLVYFPIWEVNYSYKGIIFKSYLSAIDGRIIKIHAIKSHHQKLILAIGGLFGLGVLLSRSLKVAFLMLNTPAFGFSLFFLVLGFPFLLFLTAILLPYFWRLFAFREEVFIRGKLVESNPINYTENKLIRFSSLLGEKFTRFFSKKQEG
ncbi:MAG: hypothetical protein KAT17_03190 [Candidatus Aminicenantes bacterium]|nr:hypothetical protein [Candidatus Aminicenantes bacterium]